MILPTLSVVLESGPVDTYQKCCKPELKVQCKGEHTVYRLVPDGLALFEVCHDRSLMVLELLTAADTRFGFSGALLSSGSWVP
jgi:hypothetical protein